MKLLVANLGSTSFKYQLFTERGEDLCSIAAGAFDRVTDHGVAIMAGLEQLRAAGHLGADECPDAVGFKTVLGENLSGCVAADDAVLAALDGAADIAPAHNPPYAAGIRQFRRLMPGTPLVALFETAFYQWVDEPAQRYAVPESWHKAGVRRNGFHGASHKWVAERSAALVGRDDVAQRVRSLYHGSLAPVDARPLRVVSCHLGGSSSVTGIRNGLAIGSSMGLSPQGGLPQNNRVGDLDSMALPFVMRRLDLSLAEASRVLSSGSGLLGLSGTSNDMRDIRARADAGDERCQIARAHFIHQLRHWIGAFWLELGGLDVLVFTGGIGENDTELRALACQGLAEMGLDLAPGLNRSAPRERDLSAPGTRTRIFIIPANEEAVVAQETRRFLLRNRSQDTES